MGSPEVFEAIGKLMEEVTAAGVMLATDGLKPTSFGKRVKYEDGKSTVVDGPFTESKELVASYALFQVDNWDQAIYWTNRFLEVIGHGEVELRPLYEPSDFPEDLFPPEEREKEAALRDQMERNAGR
jgi:hypothetical protein